MMDLNEIRQRFLAQLPFTMEEERFFINGIRRGRAAALETRQATVRRTAAADTKRNGRKGLDDAALDDLLGKL